MELGCYEYNIMYQPGKNNILADSQEHIVGLPSTKKY